MGVVLAMRKARMDRGEMRRERKSGATERKMCKGETKCEEKRGKGRGGGGGRRNAIFPFGAFSSDRGTTCARLSDF